VDPSWALCSDPDLQVPARYDGWALVYLSNDGWGRIGGLKCDVVGGYVTWILRKQVTLDLIMRSDNDCCEEVLIFHVVG